MGHDLASLQAPGKGLYSGRGVEAPPDVNIPALLVRNLKATFEARNEGPVVPVQAITN